MSGSSVPVEGALCPQGLTIYGIVGALVGSAVRFAQRPAQEATTDFGAQRARSGIANAWRFACAGLNGWPRANATERSSAPVDSGLD